MTAPVGMNRVGRAFKTENGAINYAHREWTGSHNTDAAQWVVVVQHDADGWWAYIAEAVSTSPSISDESLAMWGDHFARTNAHHKAHGYCGSYGCSCGDVAKAVQS